MKEKFFTWKPEKFWIDGVKILIIGFLFLMIVIGFSFIIFHRDAPPFVGMIIVIGWFLTLLGSFATILIGITKQIIKEWKR